MSNDKEITENFEEFFTKYGLKEFVTVYLQRILLEMFKVGVHSTGNTPESELVHQYFFTKDGDVRSFDEINSFDAEVEDRCFTLAKNIVDSLESSFFKELPTSADEFNEITIRKLNTALQKALIKHLGVRWGK